MNIWRFFRCLASRYLTTPSPSCWRQRWSSPNIPAIISQNCLCWYFLNSRHLLRRKHFLLKLFHFLNLYRSSRKDTKEKSDQFEHHWIVNQIVKVSLFYNFFRDRHSHWLSEFSDLEARRLVLQPLIGVRPHALLRLLAICIGRGHSLVR